MELRKFRVVGILLTVGIVACSTQKNTLVSRGFHNLTAYYNYYYNANDSYKNGIKKAESGYKFNYTIPLPMLLLGEEQVTSTVSSDMDRAINKCTALIAKHSINVKPQRKKGLVTGKEKEFYDQTEFVRWARESWFLVGKAHAWKGDLDKAKLTFEYVLLQFPNTPIWYESQVWLARVSILNGDYVDASDRLKSVETNKRKPRTTEFKHLLSSTWAFYYLKQKSNDDAVAYIKKSIEYAPRKIERLRYTYILAQIQQQEGKTAESIKLYQKILSMNPPYDMAFSIRINLIALGNVQGSNLKQELIKLSKDDKNKDYLDQLYFTLGNIEKQEGNIEKAIEYYTLSAKLSTNNNNQKGMSYLVLADYYFGKSEYTIAQAYYDSSYNSLDKNFPDYDKLEIKTRFLNKLVDNLNVIKIEDSLQRIANMLPKERDALIASIISKVQEDEQKAKTQEMEDRQQSILYQQTVQNRTQTETQEGKWYFYNQASLSYGSSEFQLKWGKRKLEDNWRRKNKRVVDDFAETGVDTSANPQKQFSNKTPEYYLAGLPLSDSLKEISSKKIREAMLKVAETYQSDLNDSKEAKKAYLNLAESYPKDPVASSAYYNLYKLSTAEGNSADAQRYKDILLRNYPKSIQALLLSNPNYVAELSRKQSESDAFYEKTYELYKSENYADALKLANEGLTRFKDSELAPKFTLISALCLGKTSDIRSFKMALDNLSKLFPKSEESKIAQNMLAYLNQRELQLASGNSNLDRVDTSTVSNTVSKVNYSTADGEQMFVVLVPKRTNLNQLKFNLVSFNVDYFIETDLSVSNLPFNDYIDLISVTGFKDSKTAMKYYDLIKNNEQVFSLLKPEDYQFFVISIENFALFVNDKSVSDYLKFFKSAYNVEN